MFRRDKMEQVKDHQMIYYCLMHGSDCEAELLRVLVAEMSCLKKLNLKIEVRQERLDSNIDSWNANDKK